MSQDMCAGYFGLSEGGVLRRAPITISHAGSVPGTGVLKKTVDKVLRHGMFCGGGVLENESE